jgi:tetratricopeptide (TPR) repeat protein
VYYYFALLKLGRPPFADLRAQLEGFMAGRLFAAAPSSGVVALELLQLELLQYGEGAGAQDACLDGLGRLQRRLTAQAAQETAAQAHDVRGTSTACAEARLWARRATMSACNAAVRTSNWRVALVALESLRPLSLTPSRVPLEVSSLEVEVLSRMGKVFLQMGQLDEASRFFAQAAASAGDGQKSAATRVRLNSGLLAFARGDFKLAMQLFQEVKGFSGALGAAAPDSPISPFFFHTTTTTTTRTPGQHAFVIVQGGALASSAPCAVGR